MKFAETPISTQNTVYLKDEIREALKLEAGDIVEWHIENGTVVVKNNRAIIKEKERRRNNKRKEATK